MMLYYWSHTWLCTESFTFYYWHVNIMHIYLYHIGDLKQAMESECRRKGPRSPSADSDDSSHVRRRRKYDRSPSPRRNRYRRSRSRDRRSRSSSRDRRRKESRTQDWKQQAPPSQTQSSVPNPNNSTSYVSAVHNQYQVNSFVNLIDLWTRYKIVLLIVSLHFICIFCNIVLCFICIGSSTKHEPATTTDFCLQPRI